MWNPREESKTNVGVAIPPAPINPPKPQDRRTTAWIGKSVRVEGAVTSDEDLIIEGRVDGTIVVGDHNLIIGAGASIKAELNAHTITVAGMVTGNVTATERIEIHETASVEGDLKAPRIAVHEGAGIRGRVETGGGAQQQMARPYPIAV